MQTHGRLQQRTPPSRGRSGRPPGQRAGAQGPRMMARRMTTAPPPALALARRRRAQPSGKGKALRNAAWWLPARARRTAATPHSSKLSGRAGAGLAVLSAAAALAFKNRAKLISALKRNGATSTDVTPVDEIPRVPAAPAGATGGSVEGSPRATSPVGQPP